jgi:predicted lipase
VRIREKTIFKKGNESQWSSKIYTVDTARGKTIYLTDGSKKKRNMLLKIDKDTVEKESITKKVTREKRVDKLNKQAGVDEGNIRVGGRVKKVRQVLDL